MNQEPTIRLAAASDASELARLISPLGYPLEEAEIVRLWEDWLAEGNSALVLEGQGRLLGMITLHRMTVLHRPKPVGRITSLYVDDSARGQGLGRTLIEAAEVALTEAGCGMIEVTSHVRRKDAHRFYRHMDYEQTSYRFAKIVEEPPAG